MASRTAGTDLERECARELSELPESGLELEQLADAVTDAMRESAAPEPPANDDTPARGGQRRLVNSLPSTAMDRLARSLDLTVRETKLLRSALGQYIAAWRLILLQGGLSAYVRLVVLAHELAHALLDGRGRSHAEVWYLTLALLVPRSCLDDIPEGRPITVASLSWACPWPVCEWVKARRAEILRMLFSQAA